MLVSIVCHLGVGGVLLAIESDAQPFGLAGDDYMDAIEFEVAPAPLEPFDPGDEDPPPPEPDEPEIPEQPEQQAVAITEPLPEPELDLGPVTPDAGPKDAGTEVADNTTDAGVADDPPDAGTEVADNTTDAGIETAVDTLDAGTQVATTTPDAGNAVVGGDEGSPDEAKMPTGAAADLRGYTPKGELLGVLIRFDRLRDTPWAPRVDRVLAPMPDYQMIIGERKLPLTDLFDMLLISSSDPSEVTATNLAGYTPLRSTEKMREFLDHKTAPVSWSHARGGDLGTRGKSKLNARGDERVYMMPFPKWTVLTERRHLGKLTQANGGELGSFPDVAELPEWLAKIRSVGDESGKEDDGPVVVASLYGVLDTLKIPMIGEIPTPERLSVAIDIAEVGFRVHGTMTFSSEERATTFETMVNEAKDRMVETAVGRRVLGQLQALNAAKGLTLTRRGKRMSYVSSFSNADAKAMLERAAELSARFYTSRRK